MWCHFSCELRDCGYLFFFFQAEDGIRDIGVTGVQTCALPISAWETLESGFQNRESRAGSRRGFLALDSGPSTLDRLRKRSEERRVGKECRSRWSPYH